VRTALLFLGGTLAIPRAVLPLAAAGLLQIGSEFHDVPFSVVEKLKHFHRVTYVDMDRSSEARRWSEETGQPRHTGPLGRLFKASVIAQRAPFLLVMALVQ
jgi:hypothetical protein